jgi:competence protein ComEA
MKILIGVALCAVALGQQKASDAEAKKVFENVCSQCHDLSLTINHRATHDDWMELVQRMAEKGASATDDQYFAIVDYLTKNFGPAKLNVNRAVAVDLAAFFSISQQEAAAIVKYRDAHGAYKTLDELEKSGVDAKKIEAKKDAIEY